MNPQGLDPHLLHAWLTARSLARGLPLPVPEHGGFRVDTGSDTETVRWVFPRLCHGLKDLAHTIHQPRQFIKACDTPEALRAALPPHWTVHPASHVMRAHGTMPRRTLADGYHITTEHSGPVVAVRILNETGELAASGFGAQTDHVFVYDRIVTEPAHRRKGLGHVLMQTLHGAQRDRDSLELLVATDDGRALYETLGWRVVAAYASASIVAG